jgi:creatinine amidohydrolase
VIPDGLTWPDLAGRRPLLVVPIGSTEQHGPHLPLDTDTRVAAFLAERLRGALEDGGVDAVVTDPLPFGSSGEHAGFPGTLSIGQEALELVLVELVRSAGWARGTVLVNGHGGNLAPLTRAAVRLRSEARAVLVWSPGPAEDEEEGRDGGDSHAGRTETSLVLAIGPEVVRLSQAAAGNRGRLHDLLPVLQRDGVRAVAPNGVLGDPGGASAAEGERLLAMLADDLVRAVRLWSADLDVPRA